MRAGIRSILNGIVIIFILITLILTSGYMHVRNATSKSFVKQDHISSKVMNKKPLSILVMGTDVGALNRGNTGGNTDTLELITVNPN